MPPSRFTLVLLPIVALLVAAGSAWAAPGTGGSLGDTPEEHGGTTFGTPDPPRAVARLFTVKPGVVREGHRPQIRLRIEQPGARTVQARVVVINLKNREVPARMQLGSIPVGRTIPVRWPRGSKLPAGRYVIRVHARDGFGEVLARAAHASGKAIVRVKPRPKPKPRPEPEQRKPDPAPAPAPAPAPTPAPAPSGGGVFPIQGAWRFGGDGSGFGAGRGSRSHEGQDIAAADGTPLVSPLAGTVAFTDFQSGGAGEYIVINADDGRSLFFAHLQAGSTSVRPGQRVSAGTGIARVGSTGASSGPHLHFEIWEGGWRDRGGHPIDPLPQLKAWAS